MGGFKCRCGLHAGWFWQGFKAIEATGNGKRGKFVPQQLAAQGPYLRVLDRQDACVTFGVLRLHRLHRELHCKKSWIEGKLGP